MSSILVDPVEDVELVEKINKKFNILFEDLECIGSGAGGEAFKIDDKSVLKITGDPAEARALKKMSQTEVLLEPGFATVLKDDILFGAQSIDSRYRFTIYRTELLYPAKYGLEWAIESSLLDEKDVDYITDKIWELQLICLKSQQERNANNFLNEVTAKYFMLYPIFVPLIFALHEAAKQDIFLIDVSRNNLGFRFDKNGDPDIHAGLVGFDLLDMD